MFLETGPMRFSADTARIVGAESCKATLLTILTFEFFRLSSSAPSCLAGRRVQSGRGLRLRGVKNIRAGFEWVLAAAKVDGVFPAKGSSTWIVKTTKRLILVVTAQAKPLEADFDPAPFTTRRDQHFAIHKAPAGTSRVAILLSRIIFRSRPLLTRRQREAPYAAGLKEVGDGLLSSPCDGGFRPVTGRRFRGRRECRSILRHRRSLLKTCAGQEQ